MSAHRIATAIEVEAKAFRRRRFTTTEAYLEEKDAHCLRISSLVGQLRKAIGIPESLSLVPGTRYIGDRRVVVSDRQPRRQRVA